MREIMPNIILNKLVFSLILITLSAASSANENAVLGINAAKTITKNANSTPEVYTLDQAVDFALNNNPDLQIAIERIKQIVPIWKKEFYETGETWIGSEAIYQAEFGHSATLNSSGGNSSEG